MSIVTTEAFIPGIVQPYVSLPYISINKIEFYEYTDKNLYAADQYWAVMPVGTILPHTNPEIAFTGSEESIDKPFLIGQYHNKPMVGITPQIASHDVLSDLMSGVYKYLCDELPEIAYVAIQAYSLVFRMATENAMYVGGKATDGEIKPYDF